MAEELRVLMIAGLPGEVDRIEGFVEEAVETGRLPAFQVKLETAPDLDAAADALAQGRLNAVFLMLSTPDDLQTLAPLQLAHPHLPILVGVNADAESLALLALTHGAVDYWFRDTCDAREIAAIFRLVRISAQRNSSQQRLHWLENGINEVVWRARPDLSWVEVTASIQRLAGFSVEEALSMSLPDFVAPDSLPLLRAALQNSHLLQPAPPASRELTLELEHLRKDGSTFWAELMLRVETGAHGQVVAVQGLTRDVTGRHAVQAQSDYVSLHDPLTGLFNRAYLEEEIHRLEFSRYYPITMLKANFEGLRQVTEERGPSAGEEMLRHLANLLRTVFRSEDMIARMSETEFLAIMPRAYSRVGGRVLQRVLNLVDAYNQDEPDVPLNVTIEVVTAEAGQSLKEIFKSSFSQRPSIQTNP